MKNLFLLVFTFFFFTGVSGQDLLDRENDINEDNFNIKNFKSLDTEFALELLQQQAKTIVNSLASKSAAAVPYIGSAGVAMEVGASNLKLDELIIANKNYNYKLTGVLANILKVTKESRDGTMARRALYAARKVKIVDESLKAIQKCQKTRKTLVALGENGWTTTNMLRAINAIDGTLNALEKVGENLLTTKNSISEEAQALDRTEKELDLINEMLDRNYAAALKELDEKVTAQYNFEYNSALITGAMYSQAISREEAQEKVKFNMASSRNGLTAFKNIMWLFVIIFFLVAATANVWRVYFMGDDSMAIIRYNKAWLVGMAISILMASMLERVLPIIYS